MNPSIENNGYWVYQGYPMPYYPLPTQPFVFPPLFEPNFLPNKVENHLDEKFSQVSVKK